MRPKIDIILPCYNPIEGWANQVISVFEKMQKDLADMDLQLIIVNDGSSKGVTEGDVSQIKKEIPGFQWVSYTKNRGKGYALRQGVKESTGSYILLTDIDFPYTLESMTRLLKALVREQEADVLAGVRGESYYQHTPVIRKIISKFLKKIVKELLSLPVTDTQCGLKGMKSSVRPVFLKTTIDRYLFDVEFLWMAANEYQVKAFPVKLRPGVVFSKLNARVLATEGRNFIKLFLLNFIK